MKFYLFYKFSVLYLYLFVFNIDIVKLFEL